MPSRPLALLPPLLVVAIASACDGSGVEPEAFSTDSAGTAFGVWSPGPPLPWPIRAQSGVEYRGSAWVAGAVEIDGEGRGIVLRLGPEPQWSFEPIILWPGRRFDLLVAADTLYALGRAPDSTAFFALDADAGTWRRRPAPPRGLDGAVAAAAGGLHLLGGKDSVTYTYVPAEAGWVERPPTANPRLDPIAIGVDDRVWLVGVDEVETSVLEEFDPVTGAWSRLGLTPLKGQAYLTAVMDGRVHFLGGFPLGSDDPSRDHLTLDMEGLTWDTLPDIPTPRAGGAGFAWEGWVYLVSGEAVGTILDPRPPGTVDRFRPSG